MNRELVDADRMLSEHFTAAVGGKAQRYEPITTGGESSPEEAILSQARSKARARYDVVETILRGLGNPKRVIRLVYEHGTDALSSALDDAGRPLAGKPTGLVEGKNKSADAHGLLRVALGPTWGHGSFVRLAVGQHRALRAFAKRYPGKEPAHHAVLDFLAFEAGRGDAAAGLFAELRDECEEARSVALTAFSSAYAVQLELATQRRREHEAHETRSAQAMVEQARSARESGRVPACLRDLTGEKRTRLRMAALFACNVDDHDPEAS